MADSDPQIPGWFCPQTDTEVNQEEPAFILDKAAGLDPAVVLANRGKQDEEQYDSVEVGDWPASVPKQSFVSHTDLVTGAPLPLVYIAKIPTKTSHEVPAYLRYGGWNECPMPEEHVCIHRMWHERYGAEIVAVTHDVIECRVSKPPESREAAMALARQQFVYCSDIVYQGVETLSALAASVYNRSIWYFWWD